MHEVSEANLESSSDEMLASPDSPVCVCVCTAAEIPVGKPSIMAGSRGQHFPSDCVGDARV